MIEKTQTEDIARAPVRPISLALKFCLTAAGLAAACALGAGAQAQTVSPTLVQITQGDPFSGCSADNVGQQEKAFGGIVYPNTAIEPWVAIDPTDTSRLLVGHQQDRWSNGGARGLAGNVSTDGTHWSDTIPTGVSQCTGGKFTRASDPWVAFSPLGTAFFFSLVAEPTRSTISFGDTHGGMLVSRSKDHATTWEAPITLIENNMPKVFNDKNSLTADPTQPSGFVYAVWDQLSLFSMPGDTTADQLLAENDGVVIARQLVGLLTAAAGGGPGFKFSSRGPTFFSMTRNNGDTWSTARPIFDPGVNAQTIDNLIVVRPNEDVFDFFTNIASNGALHIAYIKSTDHGATWSTSATFASDIQVVGVVTPDSGQAVRDASILYSVAVDPGSAPKSGNLYLAWQDDRFSGATRCTAGGGSIPIDSILFRQSKDGGVTWSSPVKINQTPTNALHPCREQAFIPAVVVAGDGTVFVTYYDFRFDTNTPTGFEGTDYFTVFCKPADDCSKAGSWVGNEKQLTIAPFSPFNILDAPVAVGHFLGDYMGLAATGPGIVPVSVWPVFGIPVGRNQTADFTRQITIP